MISKQPGHYLDLFSGIGGFALGLYWAGWRFDEHYFSEVEPYCVELYHKRFPDAIPLGDIREIDCAKLPKGEWVITGGFPCVDISILGKRTGLEGEYSGLWIEMFEIIRKLRPRYTVVENVPAVLVRGMGRILADLASIGFNAKWEGIPAAAIGANHLRARQWIFAYSPGNGYGIQKNKVQTGRIAIKHSDWWNTKSPVCRVDDGISRQVDRHRGLGNSIVPQIAELIFRQIGEVDEKIS